MEVSSCSAGGGAPRTAQYYLAYSVPNGVRTCNYARSRVLRTSGSSKPGINASFASLAKHWHVNYGITTCWNSQSVSVGAARKGCASTRANGSRAHHFKCTVLPQIPAVTGWL